VLRCSFGSKSESAGKWNLDLCFGKINNAGALSLWLQQLFLVAENLNTFYQLSSAIPTK